MKYEVVTVGRRDGFPERNNSRYFLFDFKPKFKVGKKTMVGNYKVEVIYIKRKNGI